MYVNIGARIPIGAREKVPHEFGWNIVQLGPNPNLNVPVPDFGPKQNTKFGLHTHHHPPPPPQELFNQFQST